MNRNDLYKGFAEVDDDILERSETVSPKKEKTMWLIWAAIAACLCFVASMAIPFLQHEGRPVGEDPVQAIFALEYNGKCYEAVDIPEILEIYGLPPKITADMAGEHLEYLKHDGSVVYKCTTDETDIELYQYAPSACDGVYVLRDGKAWYAVLFCNFYQDNSDMSVGFTELYRVYGIESGADIASVTEMDRRRKNEVGTPVTDREEITAFYDMTASLLSYGDDDFEEQMFGGYSDEETQQKARIAFVNDCRCIRIETVDGLRFFIWLHPSFDWIDGGGTVSYFKIDEQMHAWIDRNLN